MGKGDKRTRRGKIFAGSFGKSRPKSKKKVTVAIKKKKKQKNKVINQRFTIS